MAALDGDVRVRVQSWVDLAEPALDLDAVALGSLVARLHLVPFDGTVPLDDWYATPVGEPAWREWVRRLHDARAPFAGELDALVPELVALDAWVARPPRAAPDLPSRPLGGQRAADAERRAVRLRLRQRRPRRSVAGARLRPRRVRG